MAVLNMSVSNSVLTSSAVVGSSMDGAISTAAELDLSSEDEDAPDDEVEEVPAADAFALAAA